MCQRCVQRAHRAVRVLTHTIDKSVFRPNQSGQRCVCVCAHDGHSKLRFRRPSSYAPLLTQWHTIPVDVDTLLAVLPNTKWDVCIHEFPTRAVSGITRSLLLRNQYRLCNPPLETHCAICCQTKKWKRRRQRLCLPCGHTFCASCIKKWLHTSNTCPICRTTVTPETLDSTLFQRTSHTCHWRRLISEKRWRRKFRSSSSRRNSATPITPTSGDS